MIRQGFIREMEHEGAQTKKMLGRIPFDRFDWKPHARSKEIGKLAIHIAEIPKWVSRILTTTEFDRTSSNILVPEVNSTKGLVALSEASVQAALQDLQNAEDSEMMQEWTFRRDGQAVFSLPRASAIRAMGLNHLIHHRGQLSVYLRLLDIPVPGMYGPSADEM